MHVSSTKHLKLVEMNQQGCRNPVVALRNIANKFEESSIGIKHAVVISINANDEIEIFGATGLSSYSVLGLVTLASAHLSKLMLKS